MKHGIRWIPARRDRLGQASPEALVAIPVPNGKKEQLVDTLIYGGLALAGAAFLWAMTRKSN